MYRKKDIFDENFKGFKKALNNISILNWAFDELSENFTFLDLDTNANREKKIFDYKVHVKKESLSLYLP